MSALFGKCCNRFGLPRALKQLKFQPCVVEQRLLMPEFTHVANLQRLVEKIYASPRIFAPRLHFLYKQTVVVGARDSISMLDNSDTGKNTMNKLYRGLLGGASALALGIGASSVLAADIDRIEEAHSERVPALTMGIHWFNLEVDREIGTLTTTANWHNNFLGGVMRLDIPMHDVFSLQFDAQGDVNLEVDTDSTSEEYAIGSLIGVHVNYREPESYLLGGFVGGGEIQMESGDSSGAARYWLAGIEGQYHMDDWTFYVQGGAGDLKDDDNSQSDWAGDTGFARGVVRYYINEGLGKLQGDVFYMHGANSDGVTSWVYGVEAEHHIRDYSNGFVSAFARYEYQYVDEDVPGPVSEVDSSTIMAGVRVNLGYADPKTRDRMGPGVDFADMPRIHAVTRAVD